MQVRQAGLRAGMLEGAKEAAVERVFCQAVKKLLITFVKILRNLYIKFIIREDT